MLEPFLTQSKLSVSHVRRHSRGYICATVRHDVRTRPGSGHWPRTPQRCSGHSLWEARAGSLLMSGNSILAAIQAM